MARRVRRPAITPGPGAVLLAISNGARAGELLGLRGTDIDWGDQLIRVIRKGSQAEQWLPASDAFVWPERVKHFETGSSTQF